MGSVNLSRIARTMGHGTEIDSRRKRLKRFFAWSGMELDDIARMDVDWMVPEERTGLSVWITQLGLWPVQNQHHDGR
ncbi:hypothetical protein [Endozoicomonas sp. 8E]|uniref:hypothetical protein n=1 Tax=Endozoicomonas sp. 8E TaxID=3035692 RepID=UPI002938E371|nr:hypothetical protein [Endozoicomonas sp. 8E]WOG25727.1 hypothetical protein P6910_14190 [Endozoicomonas sp. 8E]